VTQLKGRLRLVGSHEAPINVVVDLDAVTLSVSTMDVEIGSWSVAGLDVRALDDGFLIQVEDENVVINTEDDGAFARALGIHWGNPRLRRKIAASLRD
jgi:hypothetical protein